MWYKNIKAQNFLILTLSLVGIIGSVLFFNLRLEISSEEREQVETQVFSNLVNYLSGHPETDLNYIFLGISRSDPSPKILAAFKDNTPAVEPISSSRVSFGFEAPVLHASDHTKHGIQIDLKVLPKEPNGNVKVSASLYQDKITRGNYEYTLDKKNGEYKIIRVKRPEQISF